MLRRFRKTAKQPRSLIPSSLESPPGIRKASQQNSELRSFDECIEACDALAASSPPLRKSEDGKWILSNCSVRVSPDGALLISAQAVGGSERLDGESERGANAGVWDALSSDDPVPFYTSDEQKSAIVVGNDHPDGDLTSNGFCSWGWDPGTALRQTQETLVLSSEFMEERVLAKKEAAVKMASACDSFRNGVLSAQSNYGEWAVVPEGRKKDSGVKALSESVLNGNGKQHGQKTGPILFPGSSLNSAMVAMENYEVHASESDSIRWRRASLTSKNHSTPNHSSTPTEHIGLLPFLKSTTQLTHDRIRRRSIAINDATEKVQKATDGLNRKKKSRNQKVLSVRECESSVTKKINEIHRQRIRDREVQRLVSLSPDSPPTNGSDSTKPNPEIWEMVSQMSASMENGSFAPTGLPLPHRDPPTFSDVKETPPCLKPDRNLIENQFGYQQLKADVVMAEDEIQDAAAALLNALSNYDTTRRSARVSAEGCLLSAMNGQSESLRKWVDLEREGLEEKLRELKEVEKKIGRVNVKTDLNGYVEFLRKDGGEHMMPGYEDDGGIASAMAVINCHGDASQTRSAIAKESILEGWGDEQEVGIVSAEEIEEHTQRFFQTDQKESDIQNAMDILIKLLKEKTDRARIYRASLCHALNHQRSVQTEIMSESQFHGLCRTLEALMTGCDEGDSGDVANAKMCLILAQTFFYTKGEDRTDRGNRIYVKKRLMGHPLLDSEEFWDQALFQLVSESVIQSGILQNFQISPLHASASQTTKWYDLSSNQRKEAASHLHALVFSQLGALAHSMMEFGFGVERACAFVRRMSIRHQLPIAQRAILLKHLIEKDDGIVEQVDDRGWAEDGGKKVNGVTDSEVKEDEVCDG